MESLCLHLTYLLSFSLLWGHLLFHWVLHFLAKGGFIILLYLELNVHLLGNHNRLCLENVLSFSIFGKDIFLCLEQPRREGAQFSKCLVRLIAVESAHPARGHIPYFVVFFLHFAFSSSSQTLCLVARCVTSPHVLHWALGRLSHLPLQIGGVPGTQQFHLNSWLLLWLTDWTVGKILYFVFGGVPVPLWDCSRDLWKYNTSEYRCSICCYLPCCWAGSYCVY